MLFQSVNEGVFWVANLNKDDGKVSSGTTKVLPTYLTKKGYRDFDSSLGGDAITFTINIFSKKINGFNGIFVFRDILGNEVKSLKVAFTDSIAAGAEINWSEELQYNQFIESSRNFRYLELDKLILGLYIQKVIFADGAIDFYK